ncbi:histidine phosphatase family protein [Atlantibacter hermannii]|uniref:histidine phosphatase family protein n=1 Tax=Atlantibacter hermannii TaxID=565 RepID=UPI001FD2CE06|nr:histidine phosphatase family protein [Atlantibacter hermannii]WIF57206.1 histidine phosphatase family protein [Atlantibacter hermannii]
MEIILMRHGKPALRGYSRVTSLEMTNWIAEYDLSDTGTDIPPDSSKLLASSALQIISSPLPRALSSLKALGCEPDVIDEVFREAGLPIFHIPGLRLSSTLWAAFFRVMWLCGLSHNVERLEIAKQRAVKAANILVTFAKISNGPVLLMGHGVMNRLIARELRSLGLKEYRCQGNGYWNAKIYSQNLN